jgi:dihydroneopterin aldolase
MSDKYFEGKAFQIVEKVLEELNNQVRDFDKIQKSISIQLKEVARDQRYACIEDVAKNCLSENLSPNFPYCKIEGIIQNAEIKDK